MLGESVVFSSNPANLISVTQDSADKNNIRLDFDYIDTGDSCVVQIIHVGRKASKIDITGSIKGAGRPQKNSVPRDSYADKKLSWKIGDIIFSFLIPTLLGGMTLIGIFGTKNIGGRVALILLFLPICFGFFHAVSETVRKFKSPRGHEKFHEKI